jgi:hypothetical protein
MPAGDDIGRQFIRAPFTAEMSGRGHRRRSRHRGGVRVARRRGLLLRRHRRGHVGRGRRHRSHPGSRPARRPGRVVGRRHRLHRRRRRPGHGIRPVRPAGPRPARAGRTVGQPRRHQHDGGAPPDAGAGWRPSGGGDGAGRGADGWCGVARRRRRSRAAPRTAAPRGGARAGAVCRRGGALLRSARLRTCWPAHPRCRAWCTWRGCGPTRGRSCGPTWSSTRRAGAPARRSGSSRWGPAHPARRPRTRPSSTYTRYFTGSARPERRGPALYPAGGLSVLRAGSGRRCQPRGRALRRAQLTVSSI